MKRIIDISDEYYKIITEIPVHQCTADMLIIKYSIPHETVTEFADRCKECGAKYGKLLKQQSCDDAISRKELDKALYDRFHDEDSQTNMTDVSLGAIRNFVRNFPSITPQEPKWIPVSERLPETFDYVYCTCHSLIDNREDWVVETVYIPQLSNSPYSDWGNIPILNWKEAEVVAWMYRDMPKPYKAESEDDNEMSVSDKNNS